jgi:hypothetical protein
MGSVPNGLDVVTATTQASSSMTETISSLPITRSVQWRGVADNALAWSEISLAQLRVRIERS